MYLSSAVSAKVLRINQRTPVEACRLNSNVPLTSGGGYSRARVQKWNQATPGGEIVTQMRGQADKPTLRIYIGMELRAAEEFHAAFEVATPPVIFGEDGAEHVTIRSTQER